MNNLLNREIVYWGVGEICKNCLRYHPEVSPAFFVDSFSTLDEMDGKPVYRPGDIKYWKKYYVIIVVDEFAGIRKVLFDLGLIEGEDFAHYRPFFNLEYASDTKDIEKIRSIKNSLDSNKKTILLDLCLFIVRQSEKLSVFFSSYVRLHRKEYNIVIVTNLGSLEEEKASDILGCPVIDKPVINTSVQPYTCQKNNFSEEEDVFLKSVISRKYNNPVEADELVERSRYLRYRILIDHLSPDKVVMWGGWISDFYYMRFLSENNNISYRAMEHGPVPGTILSDPKGIMSQSIYGKSNDKLKNIHISDDYIYQYEKIRKYITDNQLDTRKFELNGHDEKQIEKLKRNKKTAFLVGMDESGMSINSQSGYWNEYVSGLFASMEEAVHYFFELCDEHDVNLIYKPHPGNHLKDKSLIDKGLVYVEEMSIDRLIKLSDVVISMSSAVEYKVPMYDKALIHIGYSSMWKKGCSYCPESRTELANMFSVALSDGFTEAQRDNFAKFIIRLMSKYLWDDLSERDVRYGLPLTVGFFEE